MEATGNSIGSGYPSMFAPPVMSPFWAKGN